MRFLIRRRSKGPCEISNVEALEDGGVGEANGIPNPRKEDVVVESSGTFLMCQDIFFRNSEYGERNVECLSRIFQFGGSIS